MTDQQNSEVSPCCEDEAARVHIAIIGSGSAAFSCAIKAAEGGARVTIIEGAEVIGGCCVNVGCVPSKILIRAAQLAQQQRQTPLPVWRITHRNSVALCWLSSRVRGSKNCEPRNTSIFSIPISH